MGFRSWLLGRLPAGIAVRPAECFLASLCLLSGLLIVTGVSDPPTIAKLLWRPVYIGWGVSLALGGAALLVGLSSIKWLAPDAYIIKRIPAYRLGLTLLGWSSLAYAVALALAGTWNAAVAVGTTLAFAGACFIRLLTLGRGR